MNTETKVYSSFRDPAGSVFESKGRLYRRISPAYQRDYDLLVSSGLYSRLVSENLLIPHTEIERGLISPTRVPVISYPYEWCFKMYQAAAMTTLKIQLASLECGLELKDASAYNIQFCEGQAVLIDTPSITSREPGAPWGAYGQFCRHFIGPLVLMSKVDTRLGQLMQLYLDGIPLDLVSKLLPFTLDSGINIHVKLHSRIIRAATGKPLSSFRISDRAYRRVLTSLRDLVDELDAKSEWASWVDYSGCSYSPKAFNSKFEAVKMVLQSTTPKLVLDLGANTGNFSRLAHRLGAHVVSVDSSHGCMNTAFEGRKEYPNLLPLLGDISNPCSGTGWEGLERPSLRRRVKPDLVLALALIHHLAISSALPLNYIAEYFRHWECPILIEFVPKSDPQVSKLFPAGKDIFPFYTEEEFLKQFTDVFKVASRTTVNDSVRVLYHLVPKV